MSARSVRMGGALLLGFAGCAKGAAPTPAADGTPICCESFGYGAGMEKCCETYAWMPPEMCKIPDGVVGGGKEIVAGDLCPKLP